MVDERNNQETETGAIIGKYTKNFRNFPPLLKKSMYRKKLKQQYIRRF